jgi:hypothetical protein
MKSIILYDFEVQNLYKNGKGQIRRAIPIEFLPGYNPEWTGYRPIFEYGKFFLANSKGEPATKEIKCPFGAVGEKLIVQETWAEIHSRYNLNQNDTEYCYKADYGEKVELIDENGFCFSRVPWKSPVTMPREASRLTIVPERIWRERVQNITHEDACAEGFDEQHCQKGYTWGRLGFSQEWDSRAKSGYKFADNPMVFAAEVKIK